MNLAGLETLVTIQRVGSFSRAASIRNMTLSALSMQMKSLEHELGIGLFDRSFRPPRLTPLGQQVAADASKVVEAQALLRARCVPSDQLLGALRIGFVPSMAARVLPRFLQAVADQAPMATIQFSSGLSEDLCAMVRTGQLDAALVTEIPEATHDLHTDKMALEEMVVVAPRDGTASTLAELSQGGTFFHFKPQSGIGRLIAGYCKQMNFEPADTIVLDHIETIVSCVSASLGYSLLPRPDVVHYGGDLVRFFSCLPTPVHRRLSLVSRDDSLTSHWRPHLVRLLASSFG